MVSYRNCIYMKGNVNEARLDCSSRSYRNYSVSLPAYAQAVHHRVGMGSSIALG